MYKLTILYSGCEVNSSTFTKIELNIYCLWPFFWQMCICKFSVFSVLDHLDWLIFFLVFFLFFNYYSVWLFFISLLDNFFFCSIEHHTNKNAHTRARTHVSYEFRGKRSTIRGAVCNGMWYSVWNQGVKKKAHSPKPNEKLGKIAFRVPVVIFVTLQLVTMYIVVIPKLDWFL